MTLYKLKIVFYSMLASCLLLAVASKTIFKLEPAPTFVQVLHSTDRYWKCEKDVCSLYLYPDDTGKKAGLKYKIPASIKKQIIKDYMKQSKTLYS